MVSDQQDENEEHEIDFDDYFNDSDIEDMNDFLSDELLSDLDEDGSSDDGSSEDDSSEDGDDSWKQLLEEADNLGYFDDIHVDDDESESLQDNTEKKEASKPELTNENLYKGNQLTQDVWNVLTKSKKSTDKLVKKALK